MKLGKVFLRETMWSIKYLQRSTWHKREKKIEKDDGRISNVTINDAMSQKMQRRNIHCHGVFDHF